VRRAVVDDTPDLSSEVSRVSGRAPDARDAELTAATPGVIVGTIELAPGVAPADFHAPAIAFRVSQGFLYFLLGVPGAGHSISSTDVRAMTSRCQVTIDPAVADHPLLM
jgi:hypothetical protein